MVLNTNIAASHPKNFSFIILKIFSLGSVNPQGRLIDE
jgi:hypothetical protein